MTESAVPSDAVEIETASPDVGDALRPALRVSEVDPAVPFAMRFEQVVQIDERAFWLVGWLRDVDPTRARFTVFSPEGERTDLSHGPVAFHDRPDLASVFGDAPDIPTVGFRAFVGLGRPSRRSLGWMLEMHNTAGDAIEHGAPDPVILDRAQARKLLREAASSAVDPAVIEHQIVAAAARLDAGRDAGVVEEIVDYGQVPETPDVSIVIATRWIDRIEHQVLEFARDPDIAGVEVIYAIARDRDDGELDSRADGLSSLHRLPFRVVRISAAASSARACNLGASVARGRVLVLLSGDVLPTGRGWLQAMRSYLLSHPSVGAVGPRLLYEDGSIASAGISFGRDRGSRRWKAANPLRGLAPSMDAATSARTVQAISGACMMMATEQFRARDGLYEAYFEGGDASGDLCLKLAAVGLETCYLPDVELYVLERDTSRIELDPTVSPFNDRLFDQRWGQHLAARTGVLDGSEPVGTPVAPTATVEILEIVPAALDGTSVLGAALLDTHGQRTDSPYENTYSFAIEGWAIPRSGGALTIEVRGGALPPRRTRANLHRTDLPAPLAELPGAETSGFQFVIGSLVLPLEFEVQVDAISDDGSRTSLGQILGRRQRLRSNFVAAIQPILITTTGRSGTNWLTTLLSRHPEIVACRPFQYEAVLSTYWIDVLQALASPVSYMQSIQPEHYGPHWWVGDRRSIPLPVKANDGGISRWLGGENLEAITHFCQGQVDRFYRELIRLENRTTPHFFVERSFMGGSQRAIAELYPGGREIILVRDPRDRVCSILDYNAKRGFELWGRGTAKNDDEWFSMLRVEAAMLLASWRERRDKAYLVRYEDLIADPTSALAAVFAYIGVDAGAATIGQVMEDAANTMPQAQVAHQTSESAGASVGRWQRDLSPEHKAACDQAFKEFMFEFGYEAT